MLLWPVLLVAAVNLAVLLFLAVALLEVDDLRTTMGRVLALLERQQRHEEDQWPQPEREAQGAALAVVSSPRPAPRNQVTRSSLAPRSAARAAQSIR